MARLALQAKVSTDPKTKQHSVIIEVTGLSFQAEAVALAEFFAKTFQDHLQAHGALVFRTNQQAVTLDLGGPNGQGPPRL